MKHAFINFTLAFSFCTPAFADYNLASNKKAILCSADDNQSWALNAKRTSIKFVVEGESSGSQKIIETRSDGQTFASYRTTAGILTLSDQGDTYLVDGDTETQKISCK